MEQPVCQFDVAVAGALGVAQSLDEGVVANPVQFSRYRFKTDIGHGPSLSSGIEAKWNA
jgi:hypothetical protein